MKILFLTSEGFDTPNSNNHLSMTLIEDILDAGIGIHLVSRCKKESDGTDCVPVSLINNPIFSHDAVERSQIDKNRFVRRYLDGVKFAFDARKKWIKRKDIDAVLLQSNPNSVFSAVLLKLFLKKPIVYNVYDIFPGHAHKIGVIKSALIFKIFRYVEKFLYSLCERIVAMSEDMKTALVEEGVKPEKITVISNWFDTALFRSRPYGENQFIEKYDLPREKFYVQFAGVIGYVFDYDIFISAAELLMPYEDVVFLLIGDGNLKDTVLAEIEKRGVTNIRYFPWQPLDIIADVYSACSVGIIPLKKGVIGNGVPSKACQLMACGRVVLNVVEQSNYSRIFERENIGISVTDFDPISVRDRILFLYGNPEIVEVIGANAREYALANYSREENTGKFVKLLRELEN